MVNNACTLSYRSRSGPGRLVLLLLLVLGYTCQLGAVTGTQSPDVLTSMTQDGDGDGMGDRGDSGDGGGEIAQCIPPHFSHLKFCTMMAGRNSVCGGDKTRAMDTQAIVLYRLYAAKIPDAKFRESPQCKEALSALVCANSFPSCGVPSHCAGDESRMQGVSAELCYEYVTKCGLPEFQCRDPDLWVPVGSKQPSTSVDLDPEVRCRVPWGALKFCTRIRYPVLAAPFGTADTFAARDTMAKEWYKRISTPLDTEQCRSAKKNLACSVSLPSCTTQPFGVRPVCEKACSDVASKCNEPTPCHNSTLYTYSNDDTLCSMYSREPIASRALITVLAILLVLLFLSITLVLVKVFVLRKMMSGSSYQRVPSYDIDDDEGIELPYAVR